MYVNNIGEDTVTLAWKNQFSERVKILHYACVAFLNYVYMSCWEHLRIEFLRSQEKFNKHSGQPLLLVLSSGHKASNGHPFAPRHEDVLGSRGKTPRILNFGTRWKNSPSHINIFGASCWWRSYLRHCATGRKVAGSIPDGVTGIFHRHNPSDRTMALRLTQPLTEMSTRNISWG